MTFQTGWRMEVLPWFEIVLQIAENGGGERGPWGRLGSARLGQSAGCKLHYKSTKTGLEKRSAWSSGLDPHCITNRRKWRSETGPFDRLDSGGEGTR